MLYKKIYVLFWLIIGLCTFSFFNIGASTTLLNDKVIYIDPGHGGLDPGSIYKNIYEKDINLSICKKLKKELEKAGTKVYLTRYGDYDLSNNYVTQRKKSDLNNRAKIINKSDADMYISIHLNSTNSTTWGGMQIFYDDVKKDNMEIAKVLQNQMKKDKFNIRQVSEIKGMLLNRQLKIPGVLVEAGFLSNPNDRYLLQQDSYQEKIVKSISKGLQNYYK